MKGYFMVAVGIISGWWTMNDWPWWGMLLGILGMWIGMAFVDTVIVRTWKAGVEKGKRLALAEEMLNEHRISGKHSGLDWPTVGVDNPTQDR